MASRRARQHMPQTSSGPEGDRGASVPASGDVVLSHAATVMPARARIFGDALHAGSDSDDPENSIDNWLAIDADGSRHGLLRQGRARDRSANSAGPDRRRSTRCAIRARHPGDGRHRANLRRGWNDREQDAPGRRDPTPADCGRGSKYPPRARGRAVRRAGRRTADARRSCQRPGRSARSVPYAELAVAPFGLQATGQALRTRPSQSTAVGRSIPRTDLPAKLTGGEAFIHDLRLDGMLHGRVLRPFVRTMNGVGGATVLHVDDRAVRGNARARGGRPQREFRWNRG